MKQLDLVKELKNYRKQTRGFGGSLLKGNHPKGSRPLSSKHAMHIVLRSEIAKRELSMRHPRHRVDDIVHQQAEKWGVRIYRYANVGNHLHILVRVGSRKLYQGFIRSIAGLIARSVLNSQRGRSSQQKFWQARPFTRVVRWGRDYIRAKDYVVLNAREALGFLSPRKAKALGFVLDST